MKIGFIGAGRAGCSLGKYFLSRAAEADIQVTGYYSLIEEDARWAADFTKSAYFKDAQEVVLANDIVILSTPDGAVKSVWKSLKKNQIKGRIFCHLSGSLSSDVFSGIEDYGAYPVSLHPMFAFSSKESVYQQLNKVSFTLEGHEKAVFLWKSILSAMGNPTVVIEKVVKPKYHAAASLLSNHVTAVLSAGYRLLVECGFSEDEARSLSAVLVSDNVEQVIRQGCTDALTGPVERGDIQTVERHLSVLDDVEKRIYLSCGKELLNLAKVKNPDRDYQELEAVIQG